jgi:ABC-type transport system involved in multi-copper enzyme maturation permease subunit
MDASQSSSGLSYLWRTLVVENPMAIEVSRFKRRFLEGGRGKTVNTMILVVAIVAYAALLLVIANMSGDFPPVALIFLQTGVFTLLAPALMYSSISGEREKRSWDLLLVAPISHAQIIVGKFLAALAGLAVGLALFLLPTLFTALTYKGDYSTYAYGGQTTGVVSGTMALICEELISITFGIVAAAITLFFSARCRRSLMALGITLTLMFLGLIAFPMLFSMLSYGNFSNELINLSNPVMAISRIEELRHVAENSYSTYGSSSYDGLSPIWYGIPQAIFYLMFTVLFIVWALKTVNFADGEKKFIPRKPHA